MQFQQEIDSLKSQCANLPAKNYELKLEVENGKEYSRRNSLFKKKGVFKKYSRKREAHNSQIVRHNLKHQNYSNKKKLKDKNYFISEPLTAMRSFCVKLLESSRKEGTVLSRWTSNGEIFYIKADKPKTICRMTDFARAQF